MGAIPLLQMDTIDINSDTWKTPGTWFIFLHVLNDSLALFLNFIQHDHFHFHFHSYKPVHHRFHILSWSSSNVLYNN